MCLLENLTHHMWLTLHSRFGSSAGLNLLSSLLSLDFGVMCHRANSCLLQHCRLAEYVLLKVVLCMREKIQPFNESLIYQVLSQKAYI